jgi:two-component system chemotaxis response regulator CheB
VTAFESSAIRAPTHLVVVGASAGGVPALSSLVTGVSPDLNAAILVVLHVPANGRSVLPDILQRASGLPAAHPRDREPMLAGHIYVAPPDRHLIVHDGALRVTRGAWENGYRPSIDALFRSAAHWYGSAVIGVVLSGALDDGAAGLAAIHEQGGLSIVQDPSDAAVRDMPDHALVTVPTARVMPAREIAGTINRVTTDPSAQHARGPRVLAREVAEDPDLAAAQGIPIEIEDVGPASPAGLVCPDCGGSMFDLGNETGARYRCRVGHGWTAEALNDAHGRQLEQALWAAVRVLEENQAVQRRLVDRAVQSGREQVARRVAARQEQRDRLASMLRAAIEQFGSIPPGNDGDQEEMPAATPDFATEPSDEAVL